MPCQRIIFRCFQSIQSIVATWSIPEEQNLVPQLLAHNSLIQLELDDFHVFGPVEDPVRVASFQEDADSTKAEPNHQSKQQSDAGKSKDVKDDIPQRNIRPG